MGYAEDSISKDRCLQIFLKEESFNPINTVFNKPKKGSILEKEGNVVKLRNQKIRETVAKAQKNVLMNVFFYKKRRLIS